MANPALVADFGLDIDAKSFNAAVNSVNRLEKRVKKFAKGANLLLGVLSFRAVHGVTSHFLKAASDIEEIDNKFNAVFENVSANSEKAFKDLSKNYGLAKVESKDMLAATGDLLVGFGFQEQAALDLSLKVSKLAVDLASFTNLEGGATRASAALTKALVGETEQVKALGIVVRQQSEEFRTSVKRYREVEGKTLLQAKALTTLDIAIKQSQKGIGDLSRSWGSFANQTKFMRSNLLDIAGVIGNDLLPVFTEWVVEINSAAKASSGFVSIIRGVAKVISVLAKLALNTTKVFSRMGTGIGNTVGVIHVMLTKGVAEAGKLKKQLDKEFSEEFGLTFTDNINESIADLLATMSGTVRDKFRPFERKRPKRRRIKADGSTGEKINAAAVADFVAQMNTEKGRNYLAFFGKVRIEAEKNKIAVAFTAQEAANLTKAALVQLSADYATAGLTISGGWKQMLIEMANAGTNWRASFTSAISGIESSFASAFSSIISDGGNMFTMLASMIKSFFNSVLAAFTDLLGQMVAKMALFGFLDLFSGGIFGGLAGTFSKFLGFKGGGFTGAGDPNEVAGLAHRKEFILPEAITSSLGLQGMSVGGAVNKIASLGARPLQPINMTNTVNIQGSADESIIPKITEAMRRGATQAVELAKVSSSVAQSRSGEASR